MMDVFKYFINLIVGFIKMFFSWEIMPNISFGLFLLFFFTLGFIIYLIFNLVLKRSDK